MNKSHFVYILTNKNNNVLYTGITNNLIRRVYEHKGEYHKGFTSKYKVNKLVFYESFNNPTDAITREKQIKGGSRKKKMDLIIKNNPQWRDLYDEIV